MVSEVVRGRISWIGRVVYDAPQFSYGYALRGKRETCEAQEKYKRIGADTIKVIEDIPISAKTMRKIWRQEGISSRKRRKKHVTKQNLREVKKEWALFQQIDEDTKDLVDIPKYWIQMMKKGLPKRKTTICLLKFSKYSLSSLMSY